VRTLTERRLRPASRADICRAGQTGGPLAKELEAGGAWCMDWLDCRNPLDGNRFHWGTSQPKRGKQEVMLTLARPMKKPVRSAPRVSASSTRKGKGSFFRGLLFAVPLTVLVWLAILALL